jgi:hypothetical protein
MGVNVRVISIVEPKDGRSDGGRGQSAVGDGRRLGTVGVQGRSVRRDGCCVKHAHVSQTLLA